MSVEATSTWSSFGPDAFMKLFIEQVKHQDPTQPMDPGQMMSQLAQMTSVQQLSDLATSFQNAFRTEQLSLARDLIGSQISYASSAGMGAGVVEEAAVEKDVVGVRINGVFVPLDDLKGVQGPARPALGETSGP